MNNLAKKMIVLFSFINALLINLLLIIAKILLIRTVDYLIIDSSIKRETLKDISF